MNSAALHPWLKVNRAALTTPAASPVLPHGPQIGQQWVAQGVYSNPCHVPSKAVLMETAAGNGSRNF